MPKKKTISSIEKQIKQVQNQLTIAKTRYEKLSERLIELHKEKELRKAEIIIDALNRSGKSMDELMTFLGH